jgi:hypothetical protein
MPSLIRAEWKLINRPSRLSALDRVDAQLEELIYQAFPQIKAA